jgi:hypothetical protein
MTTASRIDGSGMLRGAVSGAVISGVGDVFVMKTYYSEPGDYEMNNHVVEFEPNRRIGWEPEAGRGHPEAGPDPAQDPKIRPRYSNAVTQ